MVIKERSFSVNDSYRFGFNGKENDNDVKGEGNQLDYGMRIYDPRLGSFLSVDPMIYKLPQWSPYESLGDNPLNNIDPDGQYFVGVNGKKVNMTYNRQGKIVLGKNASPDLIELVRAINASGSKTAITQIMKIGLNKSRVHVKIETEVQEKKGQLGYGLLGLHQAHDASGKPLEWDGKRGDFNGTPEYVEDGVYKEATITIFKGNIEKSGGNGKAYGYDVTLDQEIANTFQHEANHNTDKEFIKDLKNRREGKPNEKIDPHDNIHPQEQKVYREMENSKKE